MNSKLSIIIQFVSATAVALSLLACSGNQRTETITETSGDQDLVTLTEEQFKATAIVVGKIQLKQLGGIIPASGVLDVPPQNMASVSAPLGGFLKSTQLLQGIHVRKGEAIAVVENPEYIQLQQDYLDLKSQLEFQESEFTRQKELAKENVNALKSVQSAQAQYQSMLAKVNGLKAKLKLINIDADQLNTSAEPTRAINLYAPIDGYVTEVNANIGKFVSPTDVLFKIVDTHHLHAELTVFEKDVLLVKVGQKVKFTLSNESTERLADVYLIGREISEQRTVRVHCHLEKEDPSLLPGMYLSAEIETEGTQSPALPDEAIVILDGRRYIFVVVGPSEDHAFKMTEVKTGFHANGFTEVTLPSDVAGDSDIVVKSAHRLLAKAKNPTEEE